MNVMPRKEKQPDKRCGTCGLDGGCRSTVDWCAGWRPKEKPVEEWHGFKKGELVYHRAKTKSVVIGGSGRYVNVSPLGVQVGFISCLPKHLTRLPVEHKFKVGDRVRIGNGQIGKLIEWDDVDRTWLFEYENGPCARVYVRAYNLEPA